VHTYNLDASEDVQALKGKSFHIQRAKAIGIRLDSTLHTVHTQRVTQKIECTKTATGVFTKAGSDTLVPTQHVRNKKACVCIYLQNISVYKHGLQQKTRYYTNYPRTLDQNVHKLFYHRALEITHKSCGCN